MLFTIEVSSPWFELIRDGQKMVEGRKATPRWTHICPGMLGTISHPVKNESFSVQCTGVNRYSSLKDYLETETLECTLPGVKSIEEGMAIYYQWSTPAEIAQFGFLGIHLRVI